MFMKDFCFKHVVLFITSVPFKRDDICLIYL